MRFLRSARFLPSSAAAGSAAFTLTVNGVGFVTGATVNFNGAPKATTFVSNTQITAAILASDIATAGTANVTVINPAPTPGPSGTQVFTISPNSPVPTISSLGPTHAPGGAAFTLTINGTNFVAKSVVNFNGKAEATTFISATQISAAVPPSDVTTAGNVNVTVTNPPPGGGTSPAFYFHCGRLQPRRPFGCLAYVRTASDDPNYSDSDCKRIYEPRFIQRLRASGGCHRVV